MSFIDIVERSLLYIQFIRRFALTRARGVVTNIGNSDSGLAGGSRDDMRSIWATHNLLEPFDVRHPQGRVVDSGGVRRRADSYCVSVILSSWKQCEKSETSYLYSRERIGHDDPAELRTRAQDVP